MPGALGVVAGLYDFPVSADEVVIFDVVSCEGADAAELPLVRPVHDFKLGRVFRCEDGGVVNDEVVRRGGDRFSRLRLPYQPYSSSP